MPKYGRKTLQAEGVANAKSSDRNEFGVFREQRGVMWLRCKEQKDVGDKTGEVGQGQIISHGRDLNFVLVKMGDVLGDFN